MNNIVFLARPDVFIVNSMKSFLRKNGFIPEEYNWKEPEDRPSESVSGIVISTALKSSTDKGFLDTYLECRDLFPNVPMIFSTLADPRNPIDGFLENLMGSHYKMVRAIPVGQVESKDSDLGSAKVIPVVSKGHLEADEHWPHLSSIIGTHFKG